MTCIFGSFALALILLAQEYAPASAGDKFEGTHQLTGVQHSAKDRRKPATVPHELSHVLQQKSKTPEGLTIKK